MGQAVTLGSVPSHSDNGAQCQRHFTSRPKPPSSVRPFAQQSPAHGSTSFGAQGKSLCNVASASSGGGVNTLPSPFAASAVWMSDSSHAIPTNPGTSGMPHECHPRAPGSIVATTPASTKEPVRIVLISSAGSELGSTFTSIVLNFARACGQVTRVPEQRLRHMGDGFCDGPGQFGDRRQPIHPDRDIEKVAALFGGEPEGRFVEDH